VSYSDWRKRTKVFDGRSFQNPMIEERIAKSAYKAGERQGRKDAEAIARQAIALRNMLGMKEIEP